MMVLGYSTIAQNLIPNGSFEDSNPSCPSNMGAIDAASFWSNPITSTSGADLLSSCTSNSQISIPSSNWGFQYPSSGQKYVNLIKSAELINGESYSEGITVQLIQELELGLYCLEVHLNIPEVPKYWISSLQVSLNQLFPTPTSSNLESLVIDGQFSNIPLDTSNWLNLSCTVSSEAGDKFLTIGSFSELGNTNFLIKNNNSPANIASFFIDDISLVKCGFSLNIQDTTVCTSDTLTLSVDHYNDIQYEWVFNGTVISDSATFSMYPPEEGWYYLNYVDFRGDAYIDSAYVKLENCASLELPNVFTPNNDGNNDYWKPIAEDIDQIEILIYSRWGQEVFSYSGSYNSFEGWSPHDTPEGTYYVIVKATVANGDIIDEKGSVTLLR